MILNRYSEIICKMSRKMCQQSSMEKKARVRQKKILIFIHEMSLTLLKLLGMAFDVHNDMHTHPLHAHSVQLNVCVHHM